MTIWQGAWAEQGQVIRKAIIPGRESQLLASVTTLLLLDRIWPPAWPSLITPTSSLPSYYSVLGLGHILD